MPVGKGYDSDAQRRLFHAAISPGFRGKETGITKKDVHKRDEESRGKDLPERVRKKKRKHAMYEKIAHDLGKVAAARKLAGMMGTLLRYGGPAAAGYYLAGPGYRTEGALGGLAAGYMLGGPAGRFALQRLHPEITKATETAVAGGAVPAAARAGAMGQFSAGQLPGISREMAEQLMRKAELAGSIGVGAAGGYGAGRLLGLQNPYGLQPVFPGYGRENPYGMRPE
jgi:hypothetical protein